MKTPAPINITTEFFCINRQELKHSISKILKYWLKNKNNYFVNNQAFTHYYDLYKINKPESYTNTRTMRFKHFISEELLDDFKKDNINLKISEQLLQLIYQAVTNDNWLQTIKNRLSSRNYQIDGIAEQQIYLQKISSKQIKLKLKFSFLGTAVWQNTQWDEEDLQDPPYIKINNEKSQLFSGESTMILKEYDNQLVINAKHAKAILYATAMRPAFVEPTLDELINSHLQTLDKNQTIDKKKILISAKEYYLNQRSASSLQNIFISTNFYTEQFKKSKSYQLIKKIMEEKPIPGFYL